MLSKNHMSKRHYLHRNNLVRENFYPCPHQWLFCLSNYMQLKTCCWRILAQVYYVRGFWRDSFPESWREDKLPVDPEKKEQETDLHWIFSYNICVKNNSAKIRVHPKTSIVLIRLRFETSRNWIFTLINCLTFTF